MYEFTYHRPKTLEAAAGLASSAEEAKLLAGGQTLLPTMKQRLAAPAQRPRILVVRSSRSMPISFCL